MRLEVHNLTVKYGDTTALEDVSFSVEGPGIVALLGPNGAGKTTLMRAILGLIEPSRGLIKYNGIDVTGNPALIGKYASYVPQRPPLGKYIPFTPWELVCTSIMIRRNRWPRLVCNYKQEVEKALENAGLSRDSWHRRLSSLSGGMLMRSFIARALGVGSEFILMDEPFAPVDPAGRASLARLIGDMAGSRLVMVSLHDFVLLEKYIKIIIFLNKRILAIGPPEEVLNKETLRKVYGELVVKVKGDVRIADWHAN